MLQKYLLEKKDAHYRMAFSYTKNKDDALDVIQDSIEKALKSINKNGPVDNINSWFYRILINTAIDHNRKNQRNTCMDPDDFEYMLKHEDKYENFDLKVAMDKIPHQYRTIIILKYYEGMTISSIANIMGENINTVKTRLYRGINFLRLELKENDHESAEGY